MQPLFVTGIARGGTTLLARILGCESDPFLPLYRWWRLSALMKDGTGPIPDYYFGDLTALDAIQRLDLDDIRVPEAGNEDLRSFIAERMSAESAHLLPRLDEIQGTTMRELFDSALGIARATKEVWTIEFFGPLHRAYPDAKFVLIVRDPRAVISSALRIGGIHPLSYARHWRKAIAFAEHYGDWLYVIRYEDLVKNSEAELADLGDFLELEIPMPDDIHPAREWTLPADVQAMVELVCDPEMRLAGYEPDHVSGDILGHLIWTDEWRVSWRGEVRDPAEDYELELSRTWSDDIRGAFLFEEVHRAALQWSAI